MRRLRPSVVHLPRPPASRSLHRPTQIPTLPHHCPIAHSAAHTQLRPATVMEPPSADPSRYRHPHALPTIVYDDDIERDHCPIGGCESPSLTRYVVERDASRGGEEVGPGRVDELEWDV